MIATGDIVTLVVPGIDAENGRVQEGARGQVIGFRGADVVVDWYIAGVGIVGPHEVESLRRIPRERRVLRGPDPDRMWCQLRGVSVPLTECHTSCAAPEQRPVCFMDADAFFARER